MTNAWYGYFALHERLKAIVAQEDTDAEVEREANALRECMDPLWRQMSEEERTSFPEKPAT